MVSKSTLNLVLVGAGKWGQNYISTLSQDDVNLTIANRNNWKRLIDERPNGVIVCTPPESHIEIASYSLQKDIPTMIEKPLALSMAEVQLLSEFQAPILVNHIHLFSNAYQFLKKTVSPYQIEKIVSLGFNKGPIRAYSSLWDYGCHDIAMILDLAQEYPQDIAVSEIETKNGSLYNIKLKFSKFESESLIGNGGEKRVRKFKVDCNGLRLSYNDTDRPIGYSPPLTNAIKVFKDSILGKSDERLGLDLALKVTKVLESCQILLSSTH